MQIRIELLSDTCFSSGEVYNSSIDTDVCYDAFGLPCLPAKRLKGCLREVAIELRDWGIDIPVNELFGAKRNQPSGVCISDGRLEDYENIVQALQQEKNRLLVHPQKVLREYSYTRTQTRIDSDTGTALEDSLRVTRVLKKGLVFLADVELEKEEYREHLEKCCHALRCMGMNRTRGMGEVKAELIEPKPINPEDQEKEKEKARQKKVFKCEANYNSEACYNRMDYRIELKTPLLCKSVAGGQTRTMDYIDGAKMLGVIAQSMGADFLQLEEKDELKCSNAYISGREGRYLPLSASVYRVKNEEKLGRDCAAGEQTEQLQLNSAGEKYAFQNGNKISILEVETQIRYHHSRPADKSIGHVSKKDAENQMYQLESLTEGQRFAGYIRGTSKQIHKIYHAMEKQPYFRLGYNRSAEYGGVRLVITGLKKEEEGSPCLTDRFFVKLNAPAIFYNKYGMYSTDERDLIRELEQRLGVNGLRVDKRFLKYIEVGGYNTTWDARKPTVMAFDKGTALVCHTDRPINIGKFQSVFIGERCREGYGETEITQVPTNYKIEFCEALKTEPEGKQEEDGKDCPLLVSLKKKEARRNLESEAVKAAGELRKYLREENAAAVVNQMIMIFKEQNCFESFKEAINARYDKKTEKKQNKKNMADRVLMNPKDFKNMRTDISSKHGEIGMTEEEAYRWYYGALLKQLKYDVRHLRREGDQE